VPGAVGGEGTVEGAGVVPVVVPVDVDGTTEMPRWERAATSAASEPDGVAARAGTATNNGSRVTARISNNTDRRRAFHR
jgi:hypothetical protein